MTRNGVLPDWQSLIDRYLLYHSTPAQDEKALQQYIDELLLRVAPRVLLAFVLIILLAWFLDPVLYQSDQATLSMLFWWRLVTVCCCFGVAFLLTFTALGQRYPYWVCCLGLTISAGISGANLASSGVGFHFAGAFYNIPYMLIIVPSVLSLRVIASTLITCAFIVGYVLSYKSSFALSSHGYWLVMTGMANLGSILYGHIVYHLLRKTWFQRRQLSEQAEELALAHQRAQSLLYNVLPVSVADRLQEGEANIADGLGDVTVLFADIGGFTTWSADIEPEEVVLFLNDIFTDFDRLAERYGLEKIKTIGDAYMVAGGLFPNEDKNHVQRTARMALDMLAIAADRKTPDGEPMQLRIGMHRGSVVAGVIGLHKFSYDLWGDTVNTASRMESTGAVGKIQISEAVYQHIHTQFECIPRGLIEVKGKGSMQTWFLYHRTPVAFVEPGVRSLKHSNIRGIANAKRDSTAPEHLNGLPLQ